MRIALIAAGGAIGSVLRYWIATFAQRHSELFTARWFGHPLPLGTFTVNLIGCFLIGVLAALFARHAVPHEQYRLALTVGLLGGLTTFSAFGLDTFMLLERGHWWLALFNIGISCAIGIGAVALGYHVVQYVAGR
jgi:CrcB protein